MGTVGQNPRRIAGLRPADSLPVKAVHFSLRVKGDHSLPWRSRFSAAREEDGVPRERSRELRKPVVMTNRGEHVLRQQKLKPARVSRLQASHLACDLLIFI